MLSWKERRPVRRQFHDRITCEVCGTAFQDTSACCPICGWRPDGGAEEPAVDPAELENFDLDDLTKELNGDSKKKEPKRVFDFDAVNPQKNAAVSDEDDDTDITLPSRMRRSPRRPMWALWWCW